MGPKIITCASWKGGTGKTTITAAIMITLARMGKKILAIGLDSVLSLEKAFGVTGKEKSTMDLLNGDTEDVVYRIEGIKEEIDIIPADKRIRHMTSLPEKVLKIYMKKLDLSKYDYVFIDPPGTMNALTRNAICAADQIIVPAMASAPDLNASEEFFDEMEMMGIEASIDVVLNGFDNKKNPKTIFDDFLLMHGEFLSPVYISYMLSLKNMIADIGGYNLKGAAKKNIEDFVKKVILGQK